MAAKSKAIEIPPLTKQYMQVTLVGDTPYIANRFSEERKQGIRDRQQHKSTGGRGARNPEAEFLASLYEIPGQPGAYGVPAMASNNAAVRAVCGGRG